MNAALAVLGVFVVFAALIGIVVYTADPDRDKRKPRKTGLKAEDGMTKKEAR